MNSAAVLCLHAADLQIGGVPAGIEQADAGDDVLSTLLRAPSLAWGGLVEHALAEKPHCVLLTGNVFAPDGVSPGALLRFETQLQQLADAGIPVIAVPPAGSAADAAIEAPADNADKSGTEHTGGHAAESVRGNRAAADPQAGSPGKGADRLLADLASRLPSFVVLSPAGRTEHVIAADGRAIEFRWATGAIRAAIDVCSRQMQRGETPDAAALRAEFGTQIRTHEAAPSGTHAATSDAMPRAAAHHAVTLRVVVLDPQQWATLRQRFESAAESRSSGGAPRAGARISKSELQRAVLRCIHTATGAHYVTVSGSVGRCFAAQPGAVLHSPGPLQPLQRREHTGYGALVQLAPERVSLEKRFYTAPVRRENLTVVLTAETTSESLVRKMLDEWTQCPVHDNETLWLLRWTFRGRGKVFAALERQDVRERLLQFLSQNSPLPERIACVHAFRRIPDVPRSAIADRNKAAASDTADRSAGGNRGAATDRSDSADERDPIANATAEFLKFIEQPRPRVRELLREILQSEFPSETALAGSVDEVLDECDDVRIAARAAEFGVRHLSGRAQTADAEAAVNDS